MIIAGVFFIWQRLGSPGPQVSINSDEVHVNPPERMMEVRIRRLNVRRNRVSRPVPRMWRIAVAALKVIPETGKSRTLQRSTSWDCW
jgi:hypothetical protein